MALPVSIELHTGPDRHYRSAAALLWLLALANILSYADVLAWPWLVAAFLLLAWMNPWFARSLREGERLQIRRDGSAITGQGQRTWRGHCWSSRWATILRLEGPSGAVHVLVCAAQNSPSDYRHLLLWNRFPPHRISPGTAGTMWL